MNILIVYCHPSNKSYTYEILQQVITALERDQHVVQVSDLEAMNFKSEMSAEEYEREGRANLQLPIPGDVQNEHRKLAWADGVIFLYPVWWSDCPARMKGWFDRVFTSGYVYKQKENEPKLKVIPQGIVICTAGYTHEELTRQGIAQSMEVIMLNDRLGSRFQNREMIILGGTLNKDDVRASHEQLLHAVVKELRKYK